MTSDPREAGPAPYACRPADSRGRLYQEAESATRSAFQRDRDRIVHAGAFRKLQYKTQVFVYHEGDYYRTRLTHSLEVAQIARSLSRALGLNEDLAEALALAHDLGHTPFGHAGERALREAMRAHGGFDHNEQAFRVVTRLEARYAEFDGLNLTWETLEGLAKHNGPLDEPRPSLARFCERFDLELASHASAEAQVAALADDIAYNNHDIDDGLRAGLLELDELRAVPLVAEVLDEVERTYPDLERGRLIHETVRRLIGLMVDDLLTETRRRLAEARPDSAAALRALGRPVVAFSEDMRQKERTLRRLLFQRVYRHYKVNRMTQKAERVVRELFVLYLERPDCLPDAWQAAVARAEAGAAADPGGAAGQGRARVVADYIAGMTDRYALEAHEKLFDPYSRL
ncbi:dGTPase [Tistlia consotensis]|uniref:Deoxyguanosinetriphosphate triphosphohydrolase-like protein n=1 Tax=Tistlia consotensis USBA 355 TaxID=560819 RepID=A0A1Y6BQD9_9PROT|nr:deoxyguanosinetriphosphate triphosphohydrolase [Tistlia consotensis]SMF14225.1 dGTPase [Tistlia consotensis USBA 355]SNR49673.1 dGTPase [Tistlia consotensis]